jgi:hypothetical protein
MALVNELQEASVENILFVPLKHSWHFLPNFQAVSMVLTE